MAIAKVKFYNTAKGFGFIAPEEGGKDVVERASGLETAGMGLPAAAFRQQRTSR